jgi:hypothetical protein
MRNDIAIQSERRHPPEDLAVDVEGFVRFFRQRPDLVLREGQNLLRQVTLLVIQQSVVRPRQHAVPLSSSNWHP